MGRTKVQEVEKTEAESCCSVKTFQQNPEEQIRLRAYFKSEDAGHPNGKADEFWLKAEQELDSQ